MNIIVTGASGFLGSALVERLLKKDHKIYALSRHPPGAEENLIPLVGDITQPDLGLKEVPGGIDAIHHLAASHTLRQHDIGNLIWRTNFTGTRNVLNFCVKHDIPRLFFTSTSYTFARNPYEVSKIMNESDVDDYRKRYGLKTTVFKPSIILASPKRSYFGHFVQFVLLVVKVHRRAEIIRRWLEGQLKLPPIRPPFHIRGNPNARLNMITIDDVITAMVDTKDEGVFWLTHPSAPSLEELVLWVGEIILLDMRVEPEFKANPIEKAFQKLGSAFQPYLWGDSLKSDIRATSIDKKFIQDMLIHSLLKD